MAHSVADSTEVPSPHSFHVVTSCQRLPEATIAATLLAKRAGSRTRRGLSSGRQKPGDTEYEVVATWVALAGAYWCQSFGWVAQVA